MPNLILTEAGWQQRVRDKLGVEDAYLPDTVIEQPEVITVAEAMIIEQVPDYASLTGTDKVWLEAATICQCAALLCSSMSARLPVREQGPSFTQEVAIDWNKKRDELEDERDIALTRISTYELETVQLFRLSK